ncbi:MAG: flippase-like domain-containing protein [Planctomycetes bacterium]|nr:flippase-like domain-containing protein [Planctomycetota bacterium]
MPSRHRATVTAGLLLLGIAISAAWLWSTGGFESLEGLARIKVVYWAPLIAITSFHLAIRFVRWQFLLRCASVRIPTRPSLITYLASLVGAATPAYLGEALRCVFIKRNHGVRVGVTLPILILERCLDVLALAAVGIACASTLAQAGILLAAAALAATLGFGLLRGGRYGILPLTHEIPVPNMKVLAPAFILSLLAWGSAAAAPMFAARALGRELDIYNSARVFSHSTLLGGVMLMPAGLGVTGSAAMLQMKSLGFTTADALPIVALFRLTTTGFALAAGVAFLCIALWMRRTRPRAAAAEHFDEIAADYEHQYAPHIWRLLVERKVNLIVESLGDINKTGGLGLDFGCGLGQQLLAMRENGFRVVGIDPSFHLLRNARQNGVPVVAGDGLALPFADDTFDFVYTIGVLHHLAGEKEQDAAILEIRRVLKPGGRFIVQETNTRNPIFVFYMGYIFPIVKSIDEGVEHWVHPARFASAPGLELVETRFFTFLPDTLPRFLLGTMLRIERMLERSRLKPYAVHYMAVLKKTAFRRSDRVDDRAGGTA